VLPCSRCAAKNARIPASTSLTPSAGGAAHTQLTGISLWDTASSSAGRIIGRPVAQRGNERELARHAGRIQAPRQRCGGRREDVWTQCDRDRVSGPGGAAKVGVTGPGRAIKAQQLGRAIPIFGTVQALIIGQPAHFTSGEEFRNEAVQTLSPWHGERGGFGDLFYATD